MVSARAESLAHRTRRLLREAGLAPLKSKGQHFLIDSAIAQQLAAAASPDGRLPVLEIGAGLGALTFELAVLAPRVLALEVDSGLISALRAEGLPPPVELTEADGMRVDLGPMLDSHPGQWRAVGNLPYYAAVAILQRLLALGPRFERIVATVQQEVAARLAARPEQPGYGSLSVWTAFHAERITNVARVPRGAFYPQPKVDSRTVCIIPRPRPPYHPALHGLVLAVVRQAFAQRRKMLRNALLGRFGGAPEAKGRLLTAISEAGLAPDARGEDLSPEEFIALAEALSAAGPGDDEADG